MLLFGKKTNLSRIIPVSITKPKPSTTYSWLLISTNKSCEFHLQYAVGQTTNLSLTCHAVQVAFLAFHPMRKVLSSSSVH